MSVPDGSPPSTSSTGASAPASYAGPGIASVRGDIRGLRYLLYLCTALVMVVVLSLGALVIGTRAQLDDLRAQVAAAGAASMVTSTDAPLPAAAPSAASTAAPQPTGVPQLSTATALTGVELPAGADETGAIVVGDPNATTVVETYIDYQCPYCQRWEAMFGSALMQRALEPGSGLLVKQHNLAFLGETSPDLTPAGASARAASAAACVVDHDGPAVFAAFSRALFEKADPTEPPGQFTEAVLTELATAAGASADATACIADETYVPFVAATTKAGFARGVTGTPTVVVDGVTVGNAFTDPAVSGLLTTSS